MDWEEPCQRVGSIAKGWLVVGCTLLRSAIKGDNRAHSQSCDSSKPSLNRLQYQG